MLKFGMNYFSQSTISVHMARCEARLVRLETYGENQGIPAVFSLPVMRAILTSLIKTSSGSIIITFRKYRRNFELN